MAENQGFELASTGRTRGQFVEPITTVQVGYAPQTTSTYRTGRAADGRHTLLPLAPRARPRVRRYVINTRAVCCDAVKPQQSTTRANGSPKFCRRFSRVCPNFRGTHRENARFFWGLR